jgi:dGTPase
VLSASEERRNARWSDQGDWPTEPGETEGSPESPLPWKRTRAEQDRDRVLYTSALRRLATVTQVVAPTEGHVVHNRLTHTLEVAQIGRRLAQKVCYEQAELADAVGVDPDVVEAAGLAHDLGHPPFGHLAEEALDQLVCKHGNTEDGFNGNAQSFRIVTKLAIRLTPPDAGLDLTRATLNAILKYPWLRGAGSSGRHAKWGAYESEEGQFKWVRELHSEGDDRKSPEAKIMDWADDIAYSVHDVEDFYRAGLIPLERLSAPQAIQEAIQAEESDTSSGDSSNEARVFLSALYGSERIARLTPAPSRTRINTAFTDVMGYTSASPYDGTHLQRGILSRWKSELIGKYVDALTLAEPNDRGSYVDIDPDRELEVNVLKELTWHYVINNPSTATQRHGQRKAIQELFEIFAEAAKWTSREAQLIFPVSYQDAFEQLPPVVQGGLGARIRLVSDLIASMSEHQALAMYQRLTGTSLGSVLSLDWN